MDCRNAGSIAASLFRTSRARPLHGTGGYEVEKARYGPKEQAVWINKDQCFAPVPQEVWDFRTGSYRVLDKYLKPRKGRTLTLDEIDHVSRVADALAFMIDQMQQIDSACRTAFPEHTEK